MTDRPPLLHNERGLEISAFDTKLLIRRKPACVLFETKERCLVFGGNVNRFIKVGQKRANVFVARTYDKTVFLWDFGSRPNYSRRKRAYTPWVTTKILAVVTHYARLTSESPRTFSVVKASHRLLFINSVGVARQIVQNGSYPTVHQATLIGLRERTLALSGVFQSCSQHLRIDLPGLRERNDECADSFK